LGVLLQPTFVVEIFGRLGYGIFGLVWDFAAGGWDWFLRLPWDLYGAVVPTTWIVRAGRCARSYPEINWFYHYEGVLHRGWECVRRTGL